MRHPSLLLASVTLALGCGDGGTGPGPDDRDGQRLGAQFERLADSIDAGGYSPAADALRHAAEIVRLTGHATPVSVTIDGTSRSFLAVAEQIDFPNLVCSWPDSIVVVPHDGSGGGTPGDTIPAPLPPGPYEPPDCTVEGTYSMRTLIAWEPERMAEVVRIVADVGSNGVGTGVPDVMTGLPSGLEADPSDTPPPPTQPDTAPGGGGGGAGGYVGFMGEYLVRDVGSWYAFEGTQANALEGITSACTNNRRRSTGPSSAARRLGCSSDFR